MNIYKDSPIVSIVMPVYNAAGTLIESTNSVLAQNFKNFELIICNDASTDKTAIILESIKDKRIQVIHNGVNIGPGLSRNKAIDMARGKWLAFIDADDAWTPERLETLLAKADNLNDEIIFDDIFECHDTSTGIKPWRELRGRFAFNGNGIDVVKVPISNFIREKRLLIKPIFPLHLVRENKIFHSTRSFGEDTEFFLRLMALKLPLRYIPKPMYYYRITPGSMTGNENRIVMMREILEDAIHQFSHVPEVQLALQQKINMISRDEQYMPFIWLLKKKKLIDAFHLTREKPWIIPEFFRRIAQSLPYHLHRILHGGRTRGIR